MTQSDGDKAREGTIGAAGEGLGDDSWDSRHNMSLVPDGVFYYNVQIILFILNV